MRNLESSGMEIDYTASRSVRNVVESIGRAEDVRFSPNNRRLALAGFIRNRIAVFDIDITTPATGTHVALTDVVELSSPALSLPHGLDFIDDETLVVANRARDVAIFKLPAGTIDAQSCDVAPIQTLPAGGTSLLNVPGSVAVVGGREDQSEILICNNDGCSITRHRLDCGGGAIRSNEVLLRKWVDVPDGVSVNHDGRWLAVSDHGSHSVLLYEYSARLNPDAEPDGILRGAYYPHGVRFSSDGRYVFVADAGAPWVHVYARDGGDWRGVRHPLARVRIMDESLFLRGRSHPAEGGPKGIDIDAGQNVLAVASEYRSLAFFDLPAILSSIAVNPNEQSQREQSAVDIAYELHILQQLKEAHTKAKEALTKAKEALALLGYVNNSKSWRLTAPLRRLHSVLRRSG